jgi:hypothetical protein
LTSIQDPGYIINTMTTTKTKKAFDLARDSVYVADPSELCIIGGADALPEAERGPLDTVHVKGEHVLWDERLFNKIDPATIIDIDEHGVQTPILIAKIDGVPTVVNGRGRVRRARLANLRRAERGAEPLRIRCVVQKDISSAALLGRMIALNEIRDDDSLPVKIAKLGRLLAQEVTIEEAAATFGVTVPTIRTWQSYAEHATPALRAAVCAGEVSGAAALRLAKVRDPAAQGQAVRELTAGDGKRTVAKARAAAAKVTRTAGSGTGVGIQGKKEQRALLNEVAAMKPKDYKGAEDFWAGVEAALTAIVGDGEPDPKLARILDRMGLR